MVTTKNVMDVPPSVAEVIAPAVTRGHTAILLLQNGLNIDRPVVKAFPSNPVLSGITVMGAREFPPGTIEHNNYDISYIASTTASHFVVFVFVLASVPTGCQSRSFFLLLFFLPP